ncbi:MAG: sensor histidine kinase, partial [Verrucomicrobia bacterium]|nr:sensor histidine kinase [Verrucomicrobiota bacterium]
RTRISRELHDEVGQALTAASVNLAVLKKEMPADNERVLKRIADSQALLSQTMDTVHGFARELRPAMLDDLGLLAALRSYVTAFSERTGIRVHVHASAPAALEKLDSAQKTVIYRVAQESLNNIAKHAAASRVNITIKKPNDHISVEILDNGKGFAMDQRGTGKPCNRLGLLGMQERVRLVKGDFSVESEPGKGTLVRVQIPLTPNDSKDTQTPAGIFAAPGYISGRGTSRLQPGF